MTVSPTAKGRGSSGLVGKGGGGSCGGRAGCRIPAGARYRAVSPRDLTVVVPGVVAQGVLLVESRVVIIDEHLHTISEVASEHAHHQCRGNSL